MRRDHKRKVTEGNEKRELDEAGVREKRSRGWGWEGGGGGGGGGEEGTETKNMTGQISIDTHNLESKTMGKGASNRLKFIIDNYNGRPHKFISKQIKSTALE